MARSSSARYRFGPDAVGLALLAMLFQLLAPALSAQHHAALASELAHATGGHHGHHQGGGRSGDPSSCVVHMAMHAAASALAGPPPPLPLRLPSTQATRPEIAAAEPTHDRPWRPQLVRAPPHCSLANT